MRIVIKPQSRSAKIKLLELPSMDFVKTEDYLQVRGSATDQAAICTRTATFHLKELQTSNTILVCRNSSEEESHLLESVHSTWEIQPISPCFDKLYEYLISTSYSSLNSEINNIKPLWSWKTITSNIQASDAEILSALARIGAFELDGRWRILDINYALEILRELLLSVRIAVEDFKSIGKEKLQDLLFNDNVPQFVSDAILQNYGMVNADTGVFGLDMNKIGTLFAKSVLKSAKKISLKKLQESWSNFLLETVGENTVEFTLSMMQTTAWIDEKEIIHYFPIEELSWNPVRRFQQIFEVKSRWRASEIVPFVREISKNQSQVEVMLLKYSRISMIDGEKYYFARACAKS